MSIEVVPTRAGLGAEIRGVNLAQPLDDATFTAIEDAYNAYGVIFFRNQSLTPPQQLAFTVASVKLNSIYLANVGACRVTLKSSL
jgi:alpha-ketoglutarate-dependent taurine dioxygenase